MGENKSFEQLSEEYVRQITKTQGKILDDFFIAYSAQLVQFGKEFSLYDICLYEYPLHSCYGIFL
jgi:hypothetical protein